mmetsp:Transcript_38732/g.44343  ORF Transcript_38732/g.44343 Transcript_38732/m.44343 type:complete len:263 (+) Transcript_38732:155-943(+)
MLCYSKLIDMNMKHNNEQQDRFFRFINKHSCNGKLKLINMGLAKEGVKTLKDLLLRPNCKIKRLYLNSNKIGDDGAKTLSKVLPVNRTLIHISLCSNEISPKGCRALFTAIKNSQTLVSFDLSSKERVNRNRIDMASIKHLSEVLQISKFLSFLDLSLLSLGNKGVAQLCRGLMKSKVIVSLAIQNNELTEECVPTLNHMITESSLEHLDLSSNHIGDEGVKVFSDCVRKNKCKLKMIDLANCRITSIGCSHLLEALSFNVS